MEISERLASLATKLQQQRGSIGTEEATKNAIIMPFIATVLGYDVFDPNEVVPEYTTDVGTKKGEKVDYAIVKDGDVQILIEAKAVGAPLSVNHASQLFRYFAVSNARIGILTNGQVWHFFTDLEKPNRMDEKPFLQLDLLDIDAALIPEVAKLTKASFDIDSVVSAAEELKYIGAIKRELAAQFREPDVDWVRVLTSRVYDGSITARVREQFTVLVSKAMRQFLADQVNDRLKTALGGQGYGDAGAPPAAVTSAPEAPDAADAGATDADQTRERGVETTMEELEGFQIIRAIACSELSLSRIVPRDTKSYFGVLVDDNNRKPIARLHFNAGTKYLGLLDETKAETRHRIETLDEIYRYADEIRIAAKRWA
ncbi:protein of unknown function DUF450 [Xylanimonas cellulosilytica DSM 15894]|uniref:Type I restriction enzyme R protein N-terminal domain-containing protein n=1 Tax=Xylanimonas cellulosilytica (strain DSM 15894 / JCM 12276 / CECT 5975 / KCTC 9989 / LMG 20990 / NBRC 107835 / XIL07) TaxID=446471 RepID=D1BUP0_XYLCX|nr:type I restriction endonuclease [Xylanimonas cellulosilytica]ACZ29281.1 protein of unknown function DUF450 [Xylanimonas cellulosilytica DSM 15894]